MERTESRPRILSALARRRSLFAALALALLVSPATLIGQTARGAAPPAPAAKPLTPAPAAPTAQELVTPPASAVRLPSGMTTQLLRAGTGKVSPRSQDWIAFFAIGRRPDGTVVQNTFTSPDPIRMQMSRLIPAWQTAFAAMVAGEQRRFWFPAEMAPKNPQTGAQEAIVFDLELVAVLKVGDPPASLKTHDPKATSAGLGAWTLTVKPGKAAVRAGR